MFPLVGRAHPSVIDLSFANPLLLRRVKEREVSLPSTGSEGVPIAMDLTPPSLIPSPKRSWWSYTDWKRLSTIIKDFRIPSAPSCPSTMDLDVSLAGSLDPLTALLKEHTPVSRPSHHSKPWWSPHLTTLRREFHSTSRMARQHGTPGLRDVANISKAGYFKGIKTAKNKHW